MQILITSPSLDINDNVGGISSLVKLLLDNSNIAYRLFVAGRKDTDPKSFKWFFRQFAVLHRFYKEAKKDIDLVHINMPFEKIGIIRDAMFSRACRCAKKPYVFYANSIKKILNRDNHQVLCCLKRNLPLIEWVRIC